MSTIFKSEFPPRGKIGLLDFTFAMAFIFLKYPRAENLKDSVLQSYKNS
jgi:hypothetical protein